MTIDDISQIFCERFMEIEPKVKAWECFDPHILRNQTKTCKPGPLHGIPIGVKDIFNTADFPTQMGSSLWKNFTPGNDARAVYNLKNAGAVIPGKTVTAEFAVHALGKTLNPHDVTRNPGTSSSGSAVAVATGMVPAAIGTQTAGSIVRPASYCGVYGCKPSFGLIPRTGMLKTCDTLDTVGFFTSHACDLRIMFDALRVHGRNYPVSYEAFSSRPGKFDSRPWRIAFVRTNAWEHAAEYSKQEYIDFAKSIYDCISQEVEEVELPKIMSSAHEVHATTYDKSLSHYFQGEYQKNELVSPIMNQIIERGMDIITEEYLAALQEQVKIQRTMDEFFKDYDIIISLSTAGIAPLRDEEEKPDPALIWTLAHLPVVSVPVFTYNGLPFGMQIVARKYNDYLLFEFIDYLRELELIPGGVNPKGNRL